MMEDFKKCNIQQTCGKVINIIWDDAIDAAVAVCNEAEEIIISKHIMEDKRRNNRF